MLRVIVESEPRAGAWNMAVDEVLLESAIHRGQATLRVYRWSEPTVSLGYFQPHDDPLLATRFSGLPVVRRLSGGGALLHDQEVTYSVVYPADHEFGDHPSRLYDTVHAGVIRLLNDRGVAARLRGSAAAEQPFLCFGRGDARDIIVGSSKVMGSAQRRRRGAVLQHGALLVQRSQFATEFPGIADMAAIPAAALENLPRLLARAITEALSEPFKPGELTQEEFAFAHNLTIARYATVLPIARAKTT